MAPRDWGTGGDRKDVLPKDTKFELGKRNNFKNSWWVMYCIPEMC